MAVYKFAEDKAEVSSVGDYKKGLRMNGADILLAALEKEGVETIFGYPGGQVLPIYDAIMKNRKIRHILTRHEQGAVHAADGYARSTGKPGVCIATSGPGATNLVTGIANAYMDSVPLVAITGQVPLSMLGRDAFQEADITGITIPITKYSYLVKDVNDIAKTVHEAFYLATTGRPGPVLIDIPKDLTVAETDFFYPPQIDLPGYSVPGEAKQDELQKAIKLLSEAERPIICAGGGIINSQTSAELLKLAELLDCPVTTTLMGKGSFPEDHPLSLGMLGMHGTAYANYAVTECDLFIGVGMRFDDRVTADLSSFASGAGIIHIDVDPAELGKNVQLVLGVAADLKKVLVSLLKLLSPRKLPAWQERIRELRRQYPLRYSKQCRLKPQFVIEQIYEATNGEAFITTEVGQHQMWAAQYYHSKRPRTFITSGGLGTMGYGLPAAIGVQVAHPEAVVFDIAGDGSIQMNSQELATAVNYNLPVNIAIIDNRYLGMVRQWQELFFEGRYSHTDLSGSPDFIKLADAYGAVGIRVEKLEDVRPALEEAINTPRPCILDFLVDREENVYPMVPAGGSLDKMLKGD